MAFMLPLSERSGVNLKGLHAPSHLLLEEDEQSDAPPKLAGEADASAATETLYAAFWGLQASFADPTAAVADEAWTTLCERLEAVLQVFANIVSTEPAAAADATDAAELAAAAGSAAEVGAEGGRAPMSVEAQADAVGREVYFAKFLTSPKLLQLQLRDAYFRRHFLVQLLIFLQTVSTERKGAPSLSPSQQEAAAALRARATELLAGIAPNGPAFAAAFENLLNRERHWMEWKAAGCAAFDRSAEEQVCIDLNLSIYVCACIYMCIYIYIYI